MPPLITSHAACKGHAPENTLAGIRAALRLRADAIEIDIRCTRDAVPVLLHDSTLDRTTDGQGRLDALTLRQLRRLDAGRGERVPTLREALDEVTGRALVVLEIKPGGIEKETLAAVRRAKALDWCCVHSFRPPVVERVRALEPKMPASLLTGGTEVREWSAVFALALSIGAQGVAVRHDVVTPQLVRSAHLRELRFSTWTVDARADARRVYASGVDAITTNFPDRVRRWLPKT